MDSFNVLYKMSDSIRNIETVVPSQQIMVLITVFVVMCKASKISRDFFLCAYFEKETNIIHRQIIRLMECNINLLFETRRVLSPRRQRYLLSSQYKGRHSGRQREKEAKIERLQSRISFNEDAVHYLIISLKGINVFPSDIVVFSQTRSFCKLNFDSPQGP